MISYKKFASQLLDWSKDYPRKLSWYQEKDPYKIWISEIMLQQTRVTQVENYYNRFIKSFPSLQKLAEAKLDQVLQSWEGLGYYSRARNLHKAVKYVVSILNSEIPSTPEELIHLSGIGTYTSAAIASFAYDYPIAAVDGNVFRVLSRIFKLKIDIHSQKGKNEIQTIANLCLADSSSSSFNQAMMNLGALICLPKNPKCHICPFEKNCLAKKDELVSFFPIKKAKIQIRKRYLHYFLIIDNKNRSIIEKRKENDIWKELYQLPLLENKSSKYLNENEILKFIKSQLKSIKNIELKSRKRLVHPLTHQLLNLNFYEIRLKNPLLLKNNSAFLVKSLKNFENFAFPRIVRKYFDSLILKQ